MAGLFRAAQLIENQPFAARRATVRAVSAARATPRGVVRRDVLPPLAVRPSPISGQIENRILTGPVTGSGGRADV